MLVSVQPLPRNFLGRFILSSIINERGSSFVALILPVLVPFPGEMIFKMSRMALTFIKKYRYIGLIVVLEEFETSATRAWRLKFSCICGFDDREVDTLERVTF